MVLKIPFLFFSNINIEFSELRKLICRFYTTTKTLPTTSQIELINRREFAILALDDNLENFIVHIATLEAISIHLS